MLVSAIVGHLVGDYLLQNDWMALNKKRSSAVCLFHCLIWASSVLLFSGAWKYELRPCLIVWPILVATHFIQDRWKIVEWWMDVCGQTGFRQNLAPWSVIVVDNVWHIVTIYVLWHGFIL